jgi:hypothetical protein
VASRDVKTTPSTPNRKLCAAPATIGLHRPALRPREAARLSSPVSFRYGSLQSLNIRKAHMSEAIAGLAWSRTIASFKEKLA